MESETPAISNVLSIFRDLKSLDMKKLVILSLLLLGMGVSSWGYDFTNKELALINNSLSFNSKVKGWINEKHPGLFDNKKEEMKLRYKCFSIFDGLMKSRTINTLSIKCFGDKASYDDFGFPDISARAAVKTNVAKFYYRLETSIDVVKDVEKGIAIISVKMAVTPFKSPSIIPMEKIDVTVESEVAINESFLSGLDGSNTEPTEASLHNAIFKAADKLTKVLTQK